MTLANRPPRRTARRTRCALNTVVESLESRRLLSTINWVNRLTSDGFSIYGANETIARAIADRAIDDWERVINNFNYSNGSNTFNLTLSAAAISGRGVTSNIANLNGKPISATIQIDDNAQGGGWYLDPNIGTSLLPDDGEYQSTFLNEFCANLAAPAGNDYYRTVAHEIGHAMGLAFTSGLLINSFTTDTNIDDPVSSGTATLRTVNFNGGAYEFTLTEMGGCHMYEGPAIPASGITQIHPNDILNDGRTVNLGVNRRQLISDSLVSLLAQAYGYTVTMPSQINSFYVNLNTTTDVITINGDINGNGSDIDSILIETVGSTTRFTVNGSVETIENSEYSSIILNAGLAADTITVAGLPAGKTLTVSAGDDTDTVVLGGAGQNLDDIDGSITLNGGNGSDHVFYNDQNNSAATTYTFVTNTIARSGAGTVTVNSFDQLQLNAGSGADLLDINGTFFGTIEINAGGGDDTINLTDHGMGALVVLDGGAGLDTININTDGVGAANAQFTLSQDLASLNIGDGGRVTMLTAGSLVIETDALSLTGDGTLDLADNDLIVDYNGSSELAAIQALINTGRAGGAWNGAGITSNAAASANPKNTTLGAMESADYRSIYGPAALFANTTIDATAVLVKYTYYGDADFNGVVNFDDYSRIDAGFNAGAAGWINGDFDGNGVVNFDDYSLIDLAFNTQTAPQRPRQQFAKGNRRPLN